MVGLEKLNRGNPEEQYVRNCMDVDENRTSKEAVWDGQTATRYVFRVES